MEDGAFEGVRVVELAQWVFVPVAGALLADWGARRSDSADPIRHDLCGTPLEARWYCPTCTVLVDDPSAAEARRV